MVSPDQIASAPRGPVYGTDDAPTIDAFMASDKFKRMLIGPFGSGKSSGCVIEILNRASEIPPWPDGIKRSRWCVIRNTLPQLRDTTIKTFKYWCPENVWGKYMATTHTYYMKWQLDDGTRVECEILFRALDRPEHVSNLLSLELTGAWVNEAREVPKIIVEALEGRVDRYPPHDEVEDYWTGVIYDTNPPDDDSWIYEVFEELKPDNCAIFRQPSGLSKQAENRTHLGKSYYENLAQGKSDDFIKVYIHGEYGYVQEGKAVYPEYSDGIHCKEYDVPRFEVWRGWDFGLTPACILTMLRPNGQWLVFDEILADNMGIERFLEQVDTHMQTYWPHLSIAGDVIDPSGMDRKDTDEGTCANFMRDDGLSPLPGKQAPEARIGSVKGRLNALVDGQPALLLHPRCKMLRKGFMGKYCYRRMHTAHDRYVDKPDKNDYSHPHDGLQYIGTHLFGRYKNLKSQPPMRVVGGVTQGRR